MHTHTHTQVVVLDVVRVGVCDCITQDGKLLEGIDHFTISQRICCCSCKLNSVVKWSGNNLLPIIQLLNAHTERACIGNAS